MSAYLVNTWALLKTSCSPPLNFHETVLDEMISPTVVLAAMLCHMLLKVTLSMKLSLYETKKRFIHL